MLERTPFCLLDFFKGRYVSPILYSKKWPYCETSRTWRQPTAKPTIQCYLTPHWHSSTTYSGGGGNDGWSQIIRDHRIGILPPASGYLFIRPNVYPGYERKALIDNRKGWLRLSCDIMTHLFGRCTLLKRSINRPEWTVINHLQSPVQGLFQWLHRTDFAEARPKDKGALVSCKALQRESTPNGLTAWMPAETKILSHASSIPGSQIRIQ